MVWVFPGMLPATMSVMPKAPPPSRGRPDGPRQRPAFGPSVRRSRGEQGDNSRAPWEGGLREGPQRLQEDHVPGSAAEPEAKLTERRLRVPGYWRRPTPATT